MRRALSALCAVAALSLGGCGTVAGLVGVVAVVVHQATGIDLVVCLLLGAIVSTTDPAAVIAIFRDVGAPKRLSILAEGESLFNDAVAISTFALVVDILVERAAPGMTGQLHTDLMGDIGVFTLKPGLDQTAYGLFSDLVDIVRNI